MPPELADLLTAAVLVAGLVICARIRARTERHRHLVALAAQLGREILRRLR